MGTDVLEDFENVRVEIVVSRQDGGFVDGVVPV
jgi:hypothetical protein